MKQRFLKITVLFSLLTLLFSACKKENRECSGSIEKTFNLTDFTRIEAGENFSIDVRKAASHSIKASGCSNDLEDLNMFVGNGNVLHISYKAFSNKRSRVNLSITLPQLNSLMLSGASNTTVSGFGNQNTVIRNILSGTAECTLTGTGINTQVELSGTAKLNVTGNTLSLYGNMSGDSRLNSYGLQSDEVDIATSGTAQAYIMPLQQLFVEASGNSCVYYKGEPTTKSVILNGTAKVVQE